MRMEVARSREIIGCGVRAEGAQCWEGRFESGFYLSGTNVDTFVLGRSGTNVATTHLYRVKPPPGTKVTHLYWGEHPPGTNGPSQEARRGCPSPTFVPEAKIPGTNVISDLGQMPDFLVVVGGDSLIE
jgi:hypothetical protein